jgi:hypothetical protein
MAAALVTLVVMLGLVARVVVAELRSPTFVALRV